MKVSLLKNSEKKTSKTSSRSNKVESKTLVLFQTKSETKSQKSTKGSTKNIPSELQDLIAGEFSSGVLTGSLGEVRLYRKSSYASYDNLLVVGLGPQSDIDAERVRRASAFAFRKVKDAKLLDVTYHLTSALAGIKDLALGARAVTEGILLSNYDFDDYKAKDNSTKSISEITLEPGKLLKATLQKGLDEAVVTCEAMNFARWLGDNPGNLMTPKLLAENTQKQAQGTKLKVTVWDKARIKKEKMGGLYGVALGSTEEPRFIIMEHKGGPASQKPIVLVGKGLTFDSGGISIKPSAGMDEMKYDMCGGAAVIGSMIAISKLKLKVNVIGLVPSSENMPGPNANKPGDILTARNGKTVEVLNTDAEGRLILMDALSYAADLKPRIIFDVATLTGAIVIALGNTHTGVFTRDLKLMTKIKNAADVAGDPVWPMPITDDHVADMKGTHADLSNISSFRGAGSSTAAAFLEQFVPKDVPWAHFDIAGTAWNTANRIPYSPKKGASGAIIRTFIEFVKSNGK